MLVEFLWLLGDSGLVVAQMLKQPILPMSFPHVDAHEARSLLAVPIATLPPNTMPSFDYVFQCAIDPEDDSGNTWTASSELRLRAFFRAPPSLPSAEYRLREDIRAQAHFVRTLRTVLSLSFSDLNEHAGCLRIL